MFKPITIPFDCVMLFNEVKLKDDVTISDIELAIGEMCNVVKNAYGDEEGGFIAGQVFENSGFVSSEGSFSSGNEAQQERGEVAIVTYWKTYNQHEKSHADEQFKEKFSGLLEYCKDTKEIGYKLLWQGVPGDD